jgi:hypothetical protein
MFSHFRSVSLSALLISMSTLLSLSTRVLNAVTYYNWLIYSMRKFKLLDFILYRIVGLFKIHCRIYRLGHLGIIAVFVDTIKGGTHRRKRKQQNVENGDQKKYAKTQVKWKCTH